MSTPTASATKLPSLLGLITMIFGAIFLVAGLGTWIAVSVNLSDENITVSDDANFAGGHVDTPWEAFAQATAIKHHSLHSSEGMTYAEIGDAMNAVKADLAAQGLSDEEIAAHEDVVKLQNSRNSVMNGSFLRASLFTSVIAFGVAALVMGLGVVLGVVGFAIRKISPATAAEPIEQAVPVAA